MYEFHQSAFSCRIRALANSYLRYKYILVLNLQMLSWANEDKISSQPKRNPQTYPETLKNQLLRSSVPIVSQAEDILAATMAPLKGLEITSNQKHIYLENRKFDQRLVKDNLLDKWPTADRNEYTERKDHRNLMESYVSSIKLSSTYTTNAPRTLEINKFQI